MRVMRIIFFVLIVFLSLPEMRIGLPSLANALRARGDVWSVRHDYLGDALLTLIPGCLAVLAAGYGAFFARKHNWLYSLVATGLVVYMAIAIPSFYMDPATRADYKVQDAMRGVQTAVEAWGNEHGKFPATDAELAQAITAAKTELKESPFQRAGRSLPYELKLTASATGPAKVAERPAMIYVAVDATATHYWMSATTLPKPVADYAIPLSDSRTGPQFVITGEAVPPSPEVAPAKAKMETKK